MYFVLDIDDQSQPVTKTFNRIGQSKLNLT